MIRGIDTTRGGAFFRRRFFTRLSRCRPWPDPVPLADVVLLIFLFFVARSSFVLQPGIRIRLPAAPFEDGTAYGTLVVTLSQEGMVFFNDQRTTLGGLRSSFQQAAHERPEAVLLVEADGRVPNRTLVEVYRMAAEAGIGEVVLATRLAAAEEEAP